MEGKYLEAAYCDQILDGPKAILELAHVLMPNTASEINTVKDGIIGCSLGNESAIMSAIKEATFLCYKLREEPAVNNVHIPRK